MWNEYLTFILEEEDRRKKKKSAPASRIFNRAGNSGTVRMAEYREIDYEDLIAEEMGMKYRHQLCPHCWSKKKYKVTGRVKEEAGKKTKFVATDGSPAVEFKVERAVAPRGGIFEPELRNGKSDEEVQLLLWEHLIDTMFK